MSVSGDASEQIVRLSLEGFEVLAKLTGSGAKNVAAMLYTIMKDKKQTKGKTRLNNMLKAGKPLKIFSIKNTINGTGIKLPIMLITSASHMVSP